MDSIVAATVELASILLVALAVGVFWGPWIALTRSIADLDEASLLAVVHTLDRNLGRLMTVLLPLALLSIVAVVVVSSDWLSRLLAVGAGICLTVALIVTVRIEVPIVTAMRSWTGTTMPEDWRRLRDRWVSFHLARVVPGFAALALLVAAAVFAG